MDWSKESRQSRGYGAAWDRLRKRILQRDFCLCQVCKKAGRISIATEVDQGIRRDWRGGALKSERIFPQAPAFV